MNTPITFTRRGVLKGLGACIALPFMESVYPAMEMGLHLLDSLRQVEYGTPVCILMIKVMNCLWYGLGDIVK